MAITVGLKGGKIRLKPPGEQGWVSRAGFEIKKSPLKKQPLGVRNLPDVTFLFPNKK